MSTAADPATDFDHGKWIDIDIFDRAIKAWPYEHLSRWSTEPPFYVTYGGWPQAVVARHTDVTRVLEDHEWFTSEKRRWPGVEKFNYFQGLPVATDNDPPAHTRLRRLMAPAFSPRRLVEIEEGLAAYVEILLDGVEDAGAIDAQGGYGRKLAAHILFGLLLELPQEDWGIFLRITHAMSAYNNLGVGDRVPAEFQAAWEAGRRYCEGLIERQRRSPKDNVVGGIIAAHTEDGRISTDELFATLFVLYVAGHGGVANTVAWTLLRLCRHRDQLELLQRQPELLAGAVDEGIRIDPNAYHVLRFAARDFAFEGLRLWKDMPVLILVGAPGYDPGRYLDPLRFDITRAARRDAMAFGYGVHHCIGMSLSRMAGRIAVGAMVRRFPAMRLADPHYRAGVIGGPKERGPDAVPLMLR